LVTKTDYDVFVTLIFSFHHIDIRTPSSLKELCIRSYLNYVVAEMQKESTVSCLFFCDTRLLFETHIVCLK